MLKGIREELHEYNDRTTFALLERVPDVTKMIFSKKKVYTFSRSANVTTITTTVGSGASGGLTFNLLQLPNPSDFTLLFDQYRIVQITVVVVPTGIQQQVPVYTAFDYDDSTVPGSPVVLLEKETLRISSSNLISERTFSPTVLRVTAGPSPTSVISETATSPWLDSAENGIPHFGFKYFIPPPTLAGLTNSYIITANFVVQCRNPS